MSLIDKAREDWKAHTTTLSGAGVDLSFSTPDGLTTAEIRGIGMSHHLKFDTEGQAVSSRNVHITFAESELVDAGYPVRPNRDVDLYKHRVTFEDSTGTPREYVILEAYPDETVGVVTCILSLWQS